MSEDLNGLDRIPNGMHSPLQTYVKTIRDLAGAQCLSVTVFGAIVAGIFNVAKHTVCNVVVLHTVDLEVLRRLAREGVKLGKARMAAPLIMTPEYIHGSLDSFPLEILEIQQQHVSIFGKDYFDLLVFHEEHLRLQCERELKTILMGMRQGLLATAGKEKLLRGLEADVAERLIRTMRGLLWLHGERDPLPAVQVVDDMEKTAKRSLAGLREALNEQSHHGWEEFRNLYDDVDALRVVIDAW